MTKEGISICDIVHSTWDSMTVITFKAIDQTGRSSSLLQ